MLLHLMISVNLVFTYSDLIGFVNYSQVLTLQDDGSISVCVSFFHESPDIDPYSEIHLIVSEIIDARTSKHT